MNSSEKREPAPASFEIELPNFEQSWFMHPDPSVDLCVMPFEPLRRQAEILGREVFCCPLDEAFIADQQTLENLAALEDVVMVGYPIGL